MNNLLPPNATILERNLAEVNRRLGEIGAPFRDLMRPDTCPEEFLPWLASALSVDSWDSDWSVDQKRETIKTSLDVHRRKGTIGAVKGALAALGYEVQLQEWFNQIPAGQPYTYQLLVNVRQVKLDQAALGRMQRVIDATKNLRSHLGKIRVTVTSEAVATAVAVTSIGREIGIGYAAPSLALLMEGAANGMKETEAAVQQLDTHLRTNMTNANYW